MNFGDDCERDRFRRGCADIQSDGAEDPSFELQRGRVSEIRAQTLTPRGRPEQSDVAISECASCRR